MVKLRVRRARACGFTLIELLVVLAIVALLLSVAVPRDFGSLEMSREVALKENLKVLRGTLDKFYADKGRFPDSLNELVEQQYLRAVPVDPITETSTSWVVIPARGTAETGIADVRSGASGTGRSGTEYQQW